MDEEKSELGAAEPSFLSRMKDHGEGLCRKVLATQVGVLSGLSAVCDTRLCIQRIFSKTG